MRRIILGGTFAYMHTGHMALLRRAFTSGDFVYIGLTTNGYTKNHKAITQSYATRKRNLEAYVSRFAKPYSIAPLRDRYGPSLKGDYYAIVVSKETRPVAQRINAIRKRAGLKAMSIITIPFKLAYDGNPISSRRIAGLEIDKYGKRLEPQRRKMARRGRNQV